MRVRAAVFVSSVLAVGSACAAPQTVAAIESASLLALLMPSAFVLLGGILLLLWARRRAKRRASGLQRTTPASNRTVQVPHEEPVPLRAAEIEVCEAVPEIEQAKVLLRFGHIDDAAASLAAVERNPADRLEGLLRSRVRAQGVDPQAAITAFADAARMFNVDLAHAVPEAGPRAALEDFPHVAEEIVARWGQRSCGVYLDCLLLDSRSGNRSGFPASVAAEIILLRRVIEQRLAQPTAAPALRVVRSGERQLAA